VPWTAGAAIFRITHAVVREQDDWNEIAQTASVAHNLTTAENARLFALLNLSFADSVIAFYDAKYTYNFWRPVTAIRAAARRADQPSRQPLFPGNRPMTAPDHYPSAPRRVRCVCRKIATRSRGDGAERLGLFVGAVAERVKQCTI
jgi:hypothetical protein